MSIKLTKDNFNDIVKDSEVPVLIDFYADWCGPCKMAAPIVEQIATEKGSDAKVCKVNVDQEMELAQAFDVVSIPTFVLIKGNKMVSRFSGLRSKQEMLNLLKA